jgi:uncharacterized membrane protein
METTQTTQQPFDAASVLPPATGSSTINLGTSERIVSAFGGAALAVIGLRNIGTLSGLTLLVGGGILLTRGLSGYCAITNYFEKGGEMKNASGMEAKTTFTINSPRSDVYAFWRKLENLPRFMAHLEQVTELDDKRSSWTAKVPGGIGKVSWEAQIQEDISGELISWSSLPGSTVDNAGEVRFTDSPDGKGTELQVSMTYRLPGGDVGSLAGKLFSPAVEKMIREDIRGFKQLMETGSTSGSEDGRTPRSSAPGQRKDNTQVYR